jgi:acyl-[acyl-carrier-protein]-phospholipid O-acyltransferase/long-chain-fatty-acid--[acyl-carrier-protein] ligase
MRRPKVADTTGLELTGGGLLTRSLIMRRLLARRVLADDEKHVGLLLPPSVAGVLANAALVLDRRVPINLNYTVSSDVMNLCIRRARIRRVLTTRKLMDRFEHLHMDAELVFLEELRDKVTLADKVIAGFQAWALPVTLLERWLGLTRIDPDEVMTVVFTSGSTGEPKGVMLTHRNVGSNVEAFDAALNLRKDDVLVGVLPLFHSYGYTVPLWGGLMLEPKVVYHYNPLEARQVGALCRKHGVTILIGTPTFLRSYVRRCAPEDFAALELVITGAEKLPSDLADAFEQRFGVRPLEGYGTTELSPVVSCNIPASRSQTGRAESKEGTVGRPLAGIEAKVVDLETGRDLGPDKSGMLLVRGPNVMKGYLDQPELTAEVIRDGWYVTGDVATIDAEGYIRITGRESRFGKIGGEMVPLTRIEEALGQTLALDEDMVSLAVTCVPDPRKGERLVVLHTGLPKPPEEICRELSRAGLPPLWIPSPDSFCQVDRIPVLGTGKVDLRRLKELALSRFAPQ